MTRRNKMTNAKQTELLLKHISQRLSGRDDCKKITYEVIIDDNGVSMCPLFKVYRDRYHRKEQDKTDIISYVHNYRMPDVRLDEFVKGTYEYQLSNDGKYRRWRKTQ